MHETASQPRHLVILGHPAPGSFNHAVAQAYADTVAGCGHDCVIRDLYALGFDPLLKAWERPGSDYVASPDLQPELEYVTDADIVTMVYPIWFGMPPAIIKGYVDRVLGAGFSARHIKDATANPFLAGKRMVLFSSSATTRPWLEEKGQWSALTQAFDNYLTDIFTLAGTEHVHFDAIVPDSSERFVNEALARVREKAFAIAAEASRARHAKFTKAVVAARMGKRD